MHDKNYARQKTTKFSEVFSDVYMHCNTNSHVLEEQTTWVYTVMTFL